MLRGAEAKDAHVRFANQFEPVDCADAFPQPVPIRKGPSHEVHVTVLAEHHQRGPGRGDAAAGAGSQHCGGCVGAAEPVRLHKELVTPKCLIEVKHHRGSLA